MQVVECGRFAWKGSLVCANASHPQFYGAAHDPDGTYSHAQGGAVGR